MVPSEDRFYEMALARDSQVEEVVGCRDNQDGNICVSHFLARSLARERENSFRSAVGLSPMVIIVHDQSFFLPSAEQRNCNDNN